MRGQWLAWVGGGLAALRVGPVQAGPVTLLVEPPKRVVMAQEIRAFAVRRDQSLAHWIWDWLSNEPEVRLVSEDRARHILDRVRGGAWAVTPTNLWVAISRVVPLTAVITWEGTEGGVNLRIHRAAGMTDFSVAWAATSEGPAALRRLSATLAAELGIPESSTPEARGFSLQDPAFLDTYFVVQRLRSEGIWNSGEAQLGLLGPFVERARRDPWGAAAMVRAGLALSRDSRQVANVGRAIEMVRQAIPQTLGTPFEGLAHEFAASHRYLTAPIEEDLIAMVMAVDPAAALTTAVREAWASSFVEVPLQEGKPRPRGQIGGAIRCLGAMRSAKAVPILERLAREIDPDLREAVAVALGHYAAPTAQTTLLSLAADRKAAVAFPAARALRHRGVSWPLAALARQCLEQEVHVDAALEALAKESSGNDAVSLLRARLQDPSGERRARAVRALSNHGALQEELLRRALADPDAEVVRAAVEGLPSPVPPGISEVLEGLANDPHEALAESVRLRLQPMAPKDERLRRQWELRVEHPYRRRQTVAALERDPSDEALEDLIRACANDDAATRAYALRCLARRSPEQARSVAVRLLMDPHRRVRLYAAAVAAQVAASEDVARLRAALAGEHDPAMRLYLQDALSRAGDVDGPPAPSPPAHQVPRDRTVVFLCGHGPESERSPFGGYYDLYYNPDASARRAHAAGKIFLARANRTTHHPAQVFLDAGWRDGYWLGLEEEFGDLSALDGVVLGEETMYFRPFQQWEAGWRLFCREMGICAQRIAGDRTRLTEPEQRAWWSWEQRIAIEGFNEIYEFVKLKFGRLRPGFQVCTFMPDQNGPCELDREWKFDIGAGYYYETNNRHRYTRIRRFKTVWPDRPVIWLVDGTPRGLHAALNYRYPPVESPVVSLHSPVYADALCAWVAGAMPGYFYARLAMGKEVKPGPTAHGVWVTLEADRATIDRALTTMFRGVEETYRTETGAHGAEDRMFRLAEEEEVASDLLEGRGGRAKGDDLFARRRATERERMRLGLLLERKMAWDCARLLTGLPVMDLRPEVLLIGDMRAETGALRFFHAYDALDRIEALAEHDLSRYRLIAIARSEGASVPEEVARRLREWVQTRPVLLYVRSWLGAAPGAGGWPWETDMRRDGDGYRLLSTQPRPVGEGHPPVAVLWRGLGYAGAVFFDASAWPPGVLRDRMCAALREAGLAASLGETIGVEGVRRNDIQVWVSCKRATPEPIRLTGVDLLTGIPNPVLEVARTATLIGEGYTATYSAAWNAVGILSEQPLAEDAVKPVADGLEVDSSGLLQAVSVNGTVKFDQADTPLPAVGPERFLPWLLESDEPGWAEVSEEGGKGKVTFLRVRGKVRFRR